MKIMLVLVLETSVLRNAVYTQNGYK